jgi:long-chain acyl-CoA synthetase
VADTTRQLTYKQLTAFAAAMRRVILRETKCQRIGIVLPSTAAMAGTFYGALWAGKTAIPLNFLLQPKELENVVADAQIDTVITISHFASMVEAWPVKCLLLEELGLKFRVLMAALLPWPSTPPTKPDDIAVMLYTSGTSGLPKGVCLSHHGLDWNARSCIQHSRMTPDQRFLGVIPQFHTFGLTVLLIIPVTLGATVYYIPRFSASAVVKSVQENRISIFLAVPSMYNAIGRLKNIPDGALESISLAISGGEPLPKNTAELIAKRFGISLLEGYGMTETSPVLTCNMPWGNKPGSVGKPLPDVQVRIVDDEGNDMQGDQPGEILVKSPGVMKGYYRKPEETRAVITDDGWLHTGDMGTLDAEGYVTITGRKKEMIIVGGENVYPREVENVLVDHPAVAEAAVVGRQDQSRGEVVVAYVILTEGSGATDIELREHCRAHLGGFKVPREIIITPDLPRGPTGKVQKRVLVEQNTAASAGQPAG